jgi:serine/threonine protein kinase
LGKGSFGRVILAVEKMTKLVCAIKIMSKQEIKEDGMIEQLIR